MKIPKFFCSLPVFICLILIAGCSSDDQMTPDGPVPDVLTDDSGEGITVDEPRARPAAGGMNSAAYFVIRNHETEADRLLEVSSDVAAMVQVHESFAEEDGMAGMRDAAEPEISGKSTLQFQAGGLHVMLMRLRRDLQPGDEFDLTLRFENGEEVTVTVPVVEN